jgi:proteasome accessory factor B
VSDRQDSLSLGTDAKTERLLNLVIALLGTKSFMKKSEILKEIPGYTGSIEARERMFERDKEDLRRVGIAIQVSSLDPLFDDEQGYRISKSEYGFQLGSLSSEEYLIASAAIELMRSKVETPERIGLKRRIIAASAGQDPSDDSLFGEIKHGIDLPDHRVIEVFLCIRSRRRVSFAYQGEVNDPITQRLISPRAIGRRGEDWFVIGFDHEKESVIKAVDGDFYEEPIDVQREFEGIHKSLHTLVVRVETQFAPFFEREGGKIVKEDESFSEIAFAVPSVQRLLRVLLSVTRKFVVVSPKSAVAELEALLARLVNGH